MGGMRRLADELDAWTAQGWVAEVWWRDDDLGAPTSALDPLLTLAVEYDMDPMLAVVPAWATADLRGALSGTKVTVAVHGYAHEDYESGRAKKSEFGVSRDADDAARDVASGKKRLEDLLGSSVAGCFVPPWNRIADIHAACLPALGFAALSTFGDESRQAPVEGLVRINTHVDLIDWHGGRCFVGTDALADGMAADLRRRRVAGGGGVTGLLTHHLDMTESDWRGVSEMCGLLMTHGGARMLDSRELMRRDLN